MRPEAGPESPETGPRPLGQKLFLVPWIALSLLLVKDSLVVGMTSFNIASTSFLVALVAICGLLALPALRRDPSFRFFSPRFALPAAWWLWMVLCRLVQNEPPADGSAVVVYTFQFVLYLALSLSLASSQASAGGSPWPRRLLAATLVGMGVHQGILGFLQHAGLWGAESLAGLGGRVAGSLSNPNPYAGFLVLCLPLAWGLFGETGKWWLTVPLSLGVSGFLLAAALLSQSRGALVALAAAAVLFAALFALGRKWILLGSLLVLVSAAGAVFGVNLVVRYETAFHEYVAGYWNAYSLTVILDAKVKYPESALPAMDMDRNGLLDENDRKLAIRLRDENAPPAEPAAAASAAGKVDDRGFLFTAAADLRSRFLTLTENCNTEVAARTMFYRATWNILSGHGLFGLGPGSWQSAGLSHMPFYIEGTIHPHNLGLLWAAEMGFPGLAFWALLAAGLAWGTFRLARRGRIGAHALLPAVALALLVGLVHNLVDVTALMRVMRFAFPAFLALLWSFPGGRASRERKESSPATAAQTE